MIGWIKLHRQIIENELYFSERFTKTQAWVDLLLLANHKPVTLFLRGIEIKLNAGDLAHSMQTLGRRWRWNERTVKHFLKWLENRQMIQTRIANVTTVISIVKYTDYQQTTEQTTEQSTSRIHTDKNVKNERYTLDSAELQLSSLLLSLILQRNPGFKQPDIQKWASHVDRMIRIDGRRPEDIERVIKWSQQDGFWQSNILSTGKLREQFDALYMKMTQRNGGSPTTPQRGNGVVL